MMEALFLLPNKFTIRNAISARYYVIKKVSGYPLPEIKERDQRIRGSTSSLDNKDLLLAHGDDILKARSELAKWGTDVVGRVLHEAQPYQKNARRI